MSYYLQIGATGGPSEFASNGGYSDFAKWAESLDVDKFEEVIHLYEWGWSQDLPDLESQLAEAIKTAHPSTVETIETMLSLLKYRSEDATVVTVTDGLGGGEDSSEKSVKEVVHAPAGSPTGGQFTSGGGGGAGASDTGHSMPSHASDGGKLMHLAELPVKLEHAVTHAVVKGAKAAVGYISELAHGGPALEEMAKAKTGDVLGKIQKGVSLLAKGGMTAAFASWVAGNKAVEAVARAKSIEPFSGDSDLQAQAIEDANIKGLNESEVARVKGICAGYDVLACKAVFLGLEHSSLKHLAGASTFIPMASAGYLAYSTATNPLATWKAAKTAVSGLVDKFKKPKALNGGDTKDAVAKLCDAAKAHADDDYFFACLTEAMEVVGEHGGNIDHAIELAEMAAKEKPKGKAFETEARDAHGQWTAGGSLGAFAGDAQHEAAATFAENVNANLGKMDAGEAVDSALEKVPKEHREFVEAHEQRISDAAEAGHVDPREVFSESDKGDKAIPAKDASAAIKTANDTYGKTVAAQSLAIDANAKYAEAKQAIKGMSGDLSREYQASIKGDATGEVEIDEHATNATKAVLAKLPEHIRTAFDADELADQLGSADGKMKGADLFGMAEEDGKLASNVMDLAWKAQPNPEKNAFASHADALKEHLATQLYVKGKANAAAGKVLGDTAEYYAKDAAVAAVAVHNAAPDHAKGRLKDEESNIADALIHGGKVDDDFFAMGHH